MNKKLPIVIAYTDGACSGNPGAGGWGVFLSHDGIEASMYGGEGYTTNNKMELMAVIKALEAFNEIAVDITIYTDSKYVCNGITTWIHNWKKNNWKTAANKPVKNIDLWKRLENSMKNHKITWKWVKGHAGDIGNEIADSLAQEGVKKYK